MYVQVLFVYDYIRSYRIPNFTLLNKNRNSSGSINDNSDIVCYYILLERCNLLKANPSFVYRLDMLKYCKCNVWRELISVPYKHFVVCFMLRCCMCCV